ncbi:DUF4351 domain-containing protein [Olivibacter ginsenosidimutans]|uniref:DUF4351 domain-containing protein n=1 Tax=Olivibacter ginsenosidimutans TaxID=1176537 RepID=A0ABP9ACH8_9SPHI
MTKKKPSVRSVDDPLWKSILEQTFAHFLTFFFPEAEEVFRLDKGFEYLDKEFETLFPPEPNNKGVRYVDKLVKVHLMEGGEQYVLCHIEVQSKKGKGDLPVRMFEYFYKIYDKYKVPITAIAILADGNKNYHPATYAQHFMGTRLTYEFNSYKILKQNEGLLRADSNPFAVVALTALMAIKHRDSNDEQLKSIKLDLYSEMMKRKMERSVRQGIYDFLAYYVRFENPDILRKFEEEIQQNQGRSTTVGTREYLLEKAKNEGVILGVKTERANAERLLVEERKKMESKNYEFVRNLILDFNFTDEQAAKASQTSIDFVQKVRAELAGKK